MKRILVLGAGRSAVFLFEYLMEHADEYGWSLTIGDADPEAARRLVGGNEAVKIVKLDATNDAERREMIENSDLVISMLPAFMHMPVAKDCLELGRNLITPSYISPEMEAMADDVEKAGLVFLNELGVDPGIDHMSAMRLINGIRDRGAE